VSVSLESRYSLAMVSLQSRYIERDCSETIARLQRNGCEK